MNGFAQFLSFGDSSDPQLDVFSALKKASNKPAKAEKAPKMKIVDRKLEEGWQTVKVHAGDDYKNKEVALWNKHDIRRYILDSYYNRVGKSLPSCPHGIFFNVIAEVEHCLEVQLKVTCTSKLLKQYIDHFFEHDLMEAMSKGKMTCACLSWDKYISSFVKSQKMASTPDAQITPVVVQEELTLDNIKSAHKIGSAYFLSNYGIPIAFQYLTLIKQQSKEDAEKYIINGLSKIKSSNGNIQEVITASQKFVYPDWFDLNCVDNILAISGEEKIKLTVGETAIFEFFRSNK